MLKRSLLPCRLLAPLFSLAIFLSLAPDAPARGSFRPSFSRSSATTSDKTDSIKVCPDLVKAARIAERNARSRSIRRCWRYVKRALVAADAVDSYPNGVSAKYAGSVLTRNYGFTKLDDVKRPEDAPVGAVLVYGGRGHGHVEFRTEHGYASDFKSSKHSPRPLIGVYVIPADS